MAAFDALLCALMLMTAGFAVLGRHRFASIAFFIIYGVFMAIAWLTLGAPDVALAEAAIGAGLTGLLLIGAWEMLDERDVAHVDPVPGPAGRILAALGSLAFAGLLGAAVLALPDHEGLSGAVEASQDRLGVSNPVTAVLLGFRGYDTLLETIVLAVSLVAVWSLTPSRLWGGYPSPRQSVRPQGIMTTFSRLLIPGGFVIGIYLVWAGSDRPGGAFQAGTLLAAIWTLGVLGGVQDEPHITGRWLRTAVMLGPAAFVAIALAGAMLDVPLVYPEDHAKAAILALEFALTLSIAATLAMLLAGPARRKR